MPYYNPRMIGGALDAGVTARTGLAVFLVVLLSLGCIGLALGFAMFGGDVVESIELATVWITADESQGTGVIITEDGYILTAAHVIADGNAEQIMVVLNSGQKNAETIVAQPTEHIGETGSPDPAAMGKDYALIKIEAERALPHLPVVGSEGVQQNDACFVAGFPLGSALETSNYGPNVTIDAGEIKGIMRGGEGGVQAFNTDVSIREGMSGGPCTDERGQIVGLAIMYSEQADANLILPTSRFKHVWEPLLRG